MEIFFESTFIVGDCTERVRSFRNVHSCKFFTTQKTIYGSYIGDAQNQTKDSTHSEKKRNKKSHYFVLLIKSAFLQHKITMYEIKVEGSSNRLPVEGLVFFCSNTQCGFTRYV